MIARGRMRLPGGRQEELLAVWERSRVSMAEFARSVSVRYSTFAHCVHLRDMSSPACQG